MQFLYPAFLYALAALAIPVLVHLFNFRRFKTVYFSNVSFLKEVKEETSSRSRIKHLLVLATRLLCLAALVLAFAQPFIPKKNTNISTGRKYVSVYVDNSFSMGAINAGMRLLDRAKQAAREIVQNYAPDDKFHLVTNDLLGRHQRLVSKEEFISQLDEVDLSPAVRTLPEIAKRQRDALYMENARNKVAYLLTDFQKSNGQLDVDSTIRYNLLPLAADARQNIYVDTAWFAEPIQLMGQTAKLIVRIKNAGEKSSDGGRISLKLNGQVKGIAEFAVGAGSFTYDTIGYVIDHTGWNTGELSIQDYPITYDDNYYISYSVADKIHVLAITESQRNTYLDALYQGQAEFVYRSTAIGGLNYSEVKGNQLVVLSNLHAISSGLAAAITGLLEQGGAVAIFPADKCDKESYTQLLTQLGAPALTTWNETEQEVNRIDIRQHIFKDVFDKVPDNMSLPKARKYYSLSASSRSGEETILSLKSGATFVGKYPYKRGQVYLCASPLDKTASDLPVHALFAPMLFKMALMGEQDQGLSHTIGSKEGISIESRGAGADHVYKVKGAETEFIPEQYALGSKVILGIKDQVRKSGLYSASLDKSDSADIFALNYDRRESDLSFFTSEQLKEQYTQSNINIANSVGVEVAQVVKEMDKGTVLWKWFIVLALIALAAETALLRFWNK
jgi:hypothetical protein